MNFIVFLSFKYGYLCSQIPADGCMRLDASGIGEPSLEFLEQPVGPQDHPFLKMHQGVEMLTFDEQGNKQKVPCRVNGRMLSNNKMVYSEQRLKNDC